MRNSSHRRFGVFTVNFEYIWHVSSAFLLILNMSIQVGILYFLNLILSMCFRVGSRGSATIKTKLSVTAINNSLQLFPVFLSKRAPSSILHRPWTEYCNIHENS